MLYRIYREYWNDSGDYSAYWTEEGQSEFFTAEPIEKIQKFVDQHNQDLITIATLRIEKDLAKARESLIEVDKQLSAVNTLTTDQIKVLGIDAEKIKASYASCQHNIETYKKDLEKIAENPYKGKGAWHVYVTQRYAFEQIDLVKFEFSDEKLVIEGSNKPAEEEEDFDY